MPFLPDASVFLVLLPKPDENVGAAVQEFYGASCKRMNDMAFFVQTTDAINVVARNLKLWGHGQRPEGAAIGLVVNLSGGASGSADTDVVHWLSRALTNIEMEQDGR